MVAPGIRRGNGFNADLCAEGRGSLPRSYGSGSAGAGAPRVRGLRGYGGSAGPEQRLLQEPLWVSRHSPRVTLLPCVGMDTRPPWPRSPGDHEGKINSATGELQGVWQQGERGRRRRFGMGFPEHPRGYSRRKTSRGDFFRFYTSLPCPHCL